MIEIGYRIQCMWIT